jgi:hypothetical protein
MNIGRIRNGAILLSAGVVLLLNTTNYVDWTVWLKIFSLWPVALIAIGIELLFKKSRLAFIAFISPLLFFATILGPALFFDSDFVDIYRTSRTYHLSRDLDSTIVEVNPSIRLNCGKLRVSSGAEKLISAELDYYKRKPLIVSEQDNEDGSVVMKISDQERKWFSGRFGKRWFWRSSARKDWEIRLTDQIPVSLNLYLKNGKGNLDFSDMKLRECDLEVNDSDVDIKIGSLLEDVTVAVESRSSEISVSVPEGSGLRIINHTNLSSISFSWFTLEEKDDGYQTTDFEQADHKLTLRLEGSIIQLKVRKYEPFEGI